MFRRILTGSILLAIVIPTVIYGKTPLFLLLSVCTLLITGECLLLFKNRLSSFYSLSLLLISIGILSFTYMHPSLSLWTHTLTKIGFIIFYAGLLIEIKTRRFIHKTTPTFNFIRLLLMVFFSFPFFLLLRYAENGLLLISFMCLIIWTTDSFALWIGKWLGKTQLSPISPNKTIEGSLGGLFMSIIVTAIFTTYLSLPFINFLALAIMINFSAQITDLHESLTKRLFNVKDSSNLLPGHGGVYDRCDSLLFTTTLVFFFAQYLL